MWCPLLKRTPDGLSDRLLFATEVGVPEAQDFYASSFKPGIASRIACPLGWQAVLESVDFDVQTDFETEEIKDKAAERVLAPEFVRGEPSVA